MGNFLKRIEKLTAKANHDLNGKSQSFQGIVVSCSGHMDSTALFHWICQNQKFFPVQVSGVVHFNFGLRGKESDEDERFVRGMAANARINAFVFRCFPEVGQIHGLSLQDWARKVRVKVYRKLRDQGQIVALAHHLNDQAETSLFRMARGTTVEKMQGMRRFENGIWRPFLHLPKSEISDYCTQNGLLHRNDRSNDTMDYSRNRIRQVVMPVLQDMFSQAALHIAQCASDSADLAHFCRNQILDSIHIQDDRCVELPLQWFDSSRHGDAIAMLAAECVLVTVIPQHNRYRKTYESFVDTVRSLFPHQSGCMRGDNSLVFERCGDRLRIKRMVLIMQKRDRLQQVRASLEPDSVQLVTDSMLFSVKIRPDEHKGSCQNLTERRQFSVIP
jgi:tRNA(Ile)-lysidine synthase